jgi:hypothetical protein
VRARGTQWQKGGLCERRKNPFVGVLLEPFVEEPEEKLRLIELGGVVQERTPAEVAAREVGPLVDQEVDRKFVVLADRGENRGIGNGKKTPKAKARKKHQPRSGRRRRPCTS